MADLVISGVDLPPYSIRGVSQTLEPIAAVSQVSRTVNGAAVDLSDPLFRKYRSTINAQDQQVPAFAWPGAQVIVDCVSELSYRTSTGSAGRTVVPGSSRVEGQFTFYRPRLTMRVVSFSAQHDEADAIVGWSLVLEEV